MKKDKVEEKISYSAMASELRKGARLYEVFKGAAEAANVLASFEKEEVSIKKNISNLSKELESLDAKCDDAYNKHKSFEDTIAEMQLDASAIVKRAKEKAAGLIRDAESRIEQYSKVADAKLNDIMKKTEEASTEWKKVVGAKEDAYLVLRKIDKQVKATKERFLKTLG